MGSRQRRPKTRGLAGVVAIGPVAIEAAPTSAASASASAVEGACRVAAATASVRCATSIVIQGTRAIAANTPHMPSETRHPAVSATGTAISGGTNVDTAMVVEYTVIIRPRRSGKYFFTRGGSSTLPEPTPANTTAVAASSDVESTARPRSRRPAAIRPIATTATRSRPNRRSNRGVSSPKTAKHTGGAAPMRPTTTDETAKSSDT